MTDSGAVVGVPRPRPESTRARIRHAAMEVVACHGFSATVDEVARASGVSARTIFRHYATHDRLIAETVKDMFEACGRYPVDDLPRLTDDLEGWIGALPRRVADVDEWLTHLCVTIHTRSARVFGQAFWDIHSMKDVEAETLSAVARFRREYRLRAVNYLAGLAWLSAGGEGAPPEDLVLTFALALSPFATQALMIDFDRSPTDVGVLTATILKDALARAVTGARARRDPGTHTARDSAG
ncbi:MAG TPA: helix-turn-helix domain-containing protein [Acidimicrobiales bacterium]|nr:helix-turn-helix domain-containing protein [Acidimicrobiales bacterium]